MASITVRNLDDETKQALRENAARHGNSMEEEARLLLDAGVKMDAAGARSRNMRAQENQAKNFQKSGGQTGEPATTTTIAGDNSRSCRNISPGSGIDSFRAIRNKRVLLIISGSVAAYKSLDLIRRLKERGVRLRAVMTRAASRFITPFSVETLCHDKIFTELFNREDEQDVGHVRLARETDLIVVAPATANLMAKMAHGIADDLASAILLVSDCPVLLAPAMNPAMWNNPATKRNVKRIRKDGARFIGPESGKMAEWGESGYGRMAEPMDIVAKIAQLLDEAPRPLTELRAIVTAGPTHEPIDPLRYIANRSSGKQGYAVAAALARAGARTILVSGPTNLNAPEGVERVETQTAEEMRQATEELLPADIAVMTAAVADWRIASPASEKIKKKTGGKTTFSLKFTENSDILKIVSRHDKRPHLVIGFAAETENIVRNAKAKLSHKGADWIMANDVSLQTGVMGGENNTVKLLTKNGIEEWPVMSKRAVARQLVDRIIRHFETKSANKK